MAHNRVMQWATMARTWWLFDAQHQCAYRSAEKLCVYLEGRHKPVYHPLSDIGDHVVVINTKAVSMADDLWRTEGFLHHTRYPGGFSKATAWQLHELEPTMVMKKAIYRALPKTLLRRTMMQRLHLFPDEEVPQEILTNVSDVIQQIQPIHKGLDQYTEEEIASFPKLFDWPEEFLPPQSNDVIATDSVDTKKGK